MALKNVLILPRHDVASASCRHRYLQYLPYLAGQGVACSVSPFFDQQYTRAVLAGDSKQWWRVAGSLARRMRALISARRYDLVVLQIEVLPFFPAACERALSAVGIPYVVDFDDAYFYQYNRHALAPVRWGLSNKMSGVMRNAALNCAGSPYLAEYARRYSEKVAIVPTVIDLARYPAAPVPPDDRTFRIGWIGSGSTTDHLRSVLPELREFCRRRNAELIAIGAKPFDADGVPIRWVEWSEATEVRELARADVGIMPLPDTEWARGKCGFKLIQAMACWRPVVASPVGANLHIVEQGATGLFARPGEWSAALDSLYLDAQLRDRMGRQARRRVEAGYSLQTWAPKVADLWNSAVDSSPRPGQDR